MRMACGERRGSAAGRGVRSPAAAVGSPALLVELVVHAVDQGLPARLDHVVRHAHRPPALVLVARLDEHAHHGLGALAVAEHAHLVVVEAHLFDLRVELAECLAKRAVEGVTGPFPCAAVCSIWPSGPSSMMVASAIGGSPSVRFSSITRKPISRKYRTRSPSSAFCMRSSNDASAPS